MARGKNRGRPQEISDPMLAPAVKPPPPVVLPASSRPHQSASSGSEPPFSQSLQLPGNPSEQSSGQRDPRLLSPPSTSSLDSRRKSNNSAADRSYRAASPNSLSFYMKNPTASVNKAPFLTDSLSHDNFEALAKRVHDSQTLSAPGFWGKATKRILYALCLVAICYPGLYGRPLWDGAIIWFWRWYQGELGHHSVAAIIAFIVVGCLRNILPQFLCSFDKKRETMSAADAEKLSCDVSQCCVVIPCYKSAETLRSTTLPACLRIFQASQIFVIANGNSSEPLDHTADVCAEFGVRHVWLPVGSKITAQFVGVTLAKDYNYCLLIDDDVLLPPDLPLPTGAFMNAPGQKKKNQLACVAYAIKSVGSNSSRGTLMQQAQDLEYKLAGLQKTFQSHYGSVIFPHGAIALWRRDVLETLFHSHPGYSISEDWWLGQTARAAGYRIAMSSSIFVETETPPRLFPDLSTSLCRIQRCGYGEMSIIQQRFFRWNFFYLFRLWANTIYLLFSWRLGWREIVTKLYVFSEFSSTLIALVMPIVLPISLIASWRLTLIVIAAISGFNMLLACWFNFFHLGLFNKRRPGAGDERVAWIAFPAYMLLKFTMVFVTTGSLYWAMYRYAFFFTNQHLRVTENVNAWRVIWANSGYCSRETRRHSSV